METTFRRRTLRDDPFLRCETLQLVPHFRSPLFSTCHLLTILKSCALKSDPTRENKRKITLFYCRYFSWPIYSLLLSCSFSTRIIVSALWIGVGFPNQTPLQNSQFRSFNISKLSLLHLNLLKTPQDDQHTYSSHSFIHARYPHTRPLFSFKIKHKISSRNAQLARRESLNMSTTNHGTVLPRLDCSITFTAGLEAS